MRLHFANTSLALLSFSFPCLLQVMCPFTPFLTEAMYQNLSKCLPADQAPPSVHFCDFPAQQDALPGDEVRGGAC